MLVTLTVGIAYALVVVRFGREWSGDAVGAGILLIGLVGTGWSVWAAPGRPVQRRPGRRANH
jgi:hypothetical protein